MIRSIIVAVVGAAVFWFISAQPFLQEWNHISIAQQLGLDFRTVFVQMGAIMLMFPVINLVFLKPLKEALDARTRYLDETYSEAESLKQRMQELKASYEQRLSEAEGEARLKIQAAIQDAQRMKDEIIGEARTQAAEIRSRTLEDLQREREKMMVDLRAQVVEMTLLATNRLIGESLDERKQRELVEQFIEQVEVKP